MFQLLTLLLWGGLLLSLLQILRLVKKPRSEEFGVSALVLLSWINIFSFMGGFSIGFFTAGINVILGVILALVIGKYRWQLLFVTAASAMLLLFMRGLVVEARSWLELLMIGGLAFSLFQAYQTRRNRGDVNFSLATLASVTILFYLSLLFNEVETMAMSIAILAFFVAISSVFLLKHYRWHFFFLSLTTLAWMQWAAPW